MSERGIVEQARDAADGIRHASNEQLRRILIDCAIEIDRLSRERDEARGYQAGAAEALAHEFEIAWPGEGEWTREPAKVEGWYVTTIGPPADEARALVWLDAGEELSLLNESRWPTPLPVMPLVPKEE